MVLRCTKKLLALIGPVRLPDPPPKSSDEDWYANLLWCERHKCLLLTHSGTLFTIFEADVRAADLRATASFVFDLIGRELINEGLPLDIFGEIGPAELIVAKTSDRSVLGCMNDMAFYASSYIDHDGGLEHTNFETLNRSLRRNINSARNYERPIDLTRNRLGTRGRGSRTRQQLLRPGRERTTWDGKISCRSFISKLFSYLCTQCGCPLRGCEVRIGSNK